MLCGHQTSLQTAKYVIRFLHLQEVSVQCHYCCRNDQQYEKSFLIAVGVIDIQASPMTCMADNMHLHTWSILEESAICHGNCLSKDTLSVTAYESCTCLVQMVGKYTTYIVLRKPDEIIHHTATRSFSWHHFLVQFCFLNTNSSLYLNNKSAVVTSTPLPLGGTN